MHINSKTTPIRPEERGGLRRSPPHYVSLPRSDEDELVYASDRRTSMCVSEKDCLAVKEGGREGGNNSKHPSRSPETGTEQAFRSFAGEGAGQDQHEASGRLNAFRVGVI